MKSILIVNNDKYFLNNLTDIFKNVGYQVISTTNSLLTIDLFNKYKPCAIIIDLYMTGKDGFEITKEIRKISQQVFILVLSARDDYLNSITYLGADLALPIATNSELIVNAVAVAEKEQLFFNYLRLVVPKHQRKKNMLKIA